MKKDVKIVAVLIIAIVLSIVAGVTIYQFLSPQRTKIYVFNQSYQAGTVISEALFTPVEVDARAVANGRKTNIGSTMVLEKDFASVRGDTLKVDVSEGLPLMNSMLSSKASQFKIPQKSDSIAVTIAVTQTSGITASLMPGSKVNVYSTYDDGHGVKTVLLLEGMRVLDTVGGSTVTLECTKDESLKLINAQSCTSIYLGLIDQTGYEYSDKTNYYYQGQD